MQVTERKLDGMTTGKGTSVVVQLDRAWSLLGDVRGAKAAQTFVEYADTRLSQGNVGEAKVWLRKASESIDLTASVEASPAAQRAKQLIDSARGTLKVA